MVYFRHRNEEEKRQREKRERGQDERESGDEINVLLNRLYK